MRMMVLEYAANGTLYEHLHGKSSYCQNASFLVFVLKLKCFALPFAVEGFDHIDWNGRMRIIMGVAYCMQYMHELKPCITHSELQSSAILLSEDGAAKVHDYEFHNFYLFDIQRKFHKRSFGSHHFEPESWNSFVIPYPTCLAIMELDMSFIWNSSKCLLDVMSIPIHNPVISLAK